METSLAKQEKQLDHQAYYSLHLQHHLFQLNLNKITQEIKSHKPLKQLSNQINSCVLIRNLQNLQVISTLNSLITTRQSTRLKILEQLREVVYYGEQGWDEE